MLNSDREHPDIPYLYVDLDQDITDFDLGKACKLQTSRMSDDLSLERTAAGSLACHNSLHNSHLLSDRQSKPRTCQHWKALHSKILYPQDLVVVFSNPLRVMCDGGVGRHMHQVVLHLHC